MNRVFATAVLAQASLVSAAAAQIAVLSDDFDSAIPAALSVGVAQLAGVQGFAGLGPAGNQFGGSFLRCPTGNIVQISLANLPPHDAISLRFLFAAIDSLDGTGTYPQGDFLRVELDGRVIFRESFANAMTSQVQSYAPPAGVQLARRTDLGFSGPGSFYTDSAYDLGADPIFNNIPHSAPTAQFTIQLEGPGIQDLGDESWAMDNLRILVRPACVADIDDGSGTGTRDGGVAIEDLLYYLSLYESGIIGADVDDGSSSGTPDGGVGIEDLLYYLQRYSAGC